MSIRNEMLNNKYAENNHLFTPTAPPVVVAVSDGMRALAQIALLKSQPASE